MSRLALEAWQVWYRSAGQGGDLDEVVGEDGLSVRDPDAVEAVDAGAVPARGSTGAPNRGIHAVLKYDVARR